MTERFDVEVCERDVTMHVRRRLGGSGVPLVMLHGWPASSAGWEKVAQQICEDRTCIFPDLRGLGDSERKGDAAAYRKLELAKDVEALLKRLDLSEYHVVGQDWGGVIAQELALSDPRCRSLTVMNINLINNPNGSQLGLARQVADPLNPRWYVAFQQAAGLAEQMVPGNEHAWIGYFLSKGLKLRQLSLDELDEYVRAYAISGTATSGANYYRAMAADYVRWASLGSTKQNVPSLILYGIDDPFITPEFYQGWEDCFKDGRRVDIAGGHFVQDDNPEAVAANLRGFLATVDDSTTASTG